MKNRKIIAIILALFMIVPFTLAGCNNDTDNTSSTASKETSSKADTTTESSEVSTEESVATLTVPESIKTAGKLVMATSADFPPYEFKDEDGNYVGIDVEIMQAIADLWDVELEISNMDFKAVITAIQTNKADVGASGMTVTEERLENVNFTYTYAKATQVIIVKEDAGIVSVADLEGKKVGVQLGTTGEIYASDDETLASVDSYATGMEAVLALTQGKVDAVIIDNEPAKVFITKNEGLKIIDEAYTDEDYAMAIAKDNTELVDAINEALTVLDENGTLDAIIEKYIPSETEDSSEAVESSN